MAGVNPYGTNEREDPVEVGSQSRRSNTTRYPGFAGGGIDPNTGNLVPASDAAQAGTNSPVSSAAPAAAPAINNIVAAPEDNSYTSSANLAKVHARVDPLGAKIAADFNERVICTELYRKREIDRALYEADVTFTRDNLSPTTVRGYQWWAIPCVRKMRRDARFRRWVKLIALARAEEIGRIAGLHRHHNWLGKLVRLIGEPTCYLIGLFVPEQDYQSLYKRDESCRT